MTRKYTTAEVISEMSRIGRTAQFVAKGAFFPHYKTEWNFGLIRTLVTFRMPPEWQPTAGIPIRSDWVRVTKGRELLKRRDVADNRVERALILSLFGKRVQRDKKYRITLEEIED